ADVNELVVPGDKRDDFEGIVLEEVGNHAAGHRRDDLLSLGRVWNDAVIELVAARLFVIGDELLERDVFFLGKTLNPPYRGGGRRRAGDIGPRHGPGGDQ